MTSQHSSAILSRSDLNSSLSHSSRSPPVQERGGGVFSTLYRPDCLSRGSGQGARQGVKQGARPGARQGTRQGTGQLNSSHRHSSYITESLAPSKAQPRPQSSLLDSFDKAFADYKQLEAGRRKLNTNIQTEKYFDNLAALLRLDDFKRTQFATHFFFSETCKVTETDRCFWQCYEI